MMSRDRALPATAPSQLSLFAEAAVPASETLASHSSHMPLSALVASDVSAASGAQFPGASGASSLHAVGTATPPLPMQAIFRHPQAEREIRFGEHVVAYALRRAKRRSIGFIVGAEGLSVNAPKDICQNLRVQSPKW